MKKNKTLKKILLIIASFVLFCFLFTVITNIIVVLRANKYIHSEPDVESAQSFVEITEDEENYFDCIIVLGCGVTPDGEPTPLLSDRLDIAISLYNKGVAPKVLLSGDHGEDSYNEVSVMRDYVIEYGVDPEDVFMDHAGFSTYDTMARARLVFGVEKAVVVTQEYHLYRALFNAQNQGIEVYGVIATGHVFHNQPYYSFREYFARTKDFIFAIFCPDPVYLGDAIDIHGSGEVTND